MKENRNAAKARNSFVTRKAEQKMDALTEVFKVSAGDHFAGEKRDTLQRSLNFNGFWYLDNLKLLYNWENRFFSVNYNLQMVSHVGVNDKFKDIDSCRFDLQFSMKRHNDRFICTSWKGKEIKVRDEYLERLNNQLILDRIHMLDIHGVTITYEPKWRYFCISLESMIGSGTWILIPPIMQLIAPGRDECVKFMELYELLGDALVNNRN